MELDALFDSKSDIDTIEADDVVDEHDEHDEHDEPASENGIGWKVLAMFIGGGLVITALVVAFMVWVIEGLVL